MRALFLTLVTFLLSITNSVAGGVGFTRITIDDPMGGKMTVSLWYPTHLSDSMTHLGPFAFEASRDAPPNAGRHGLVILSHGHAGSDLGHRNIAIELARSGIIAAAPLHPRDNFRDSSGAGQRIVMEGRPRQLSAIVDALLSGPPWQSLVDPARIGAFGFSIGGYSVLAVLGASPDLSNIVSHCRERPADPFCSLGVNNADRMEGPPADDEASPSQRRANHHFCAAVLADPVAVPFSEAEIEKITTRTIQIWYPERQNALLAEAHALHVARALNRRPDAPQAEVIQVDGAQHYSFLAPFPEVIRDSLPRQLTQDSSGFDRDMFQRDFARRVSGFFTKSLNRCAPDGE